MGGKGSGRHVERREERNPIATGMYLPNLSGLRGNQSAKNILNDYTLTTDLNISNWDDAYTHSTDNTQAHTDYLINNGNDTTTGTITAGGFTTTGTITGEQITSTDDIHASGKLRVIVDGSSSDDYISAGAADDLKLYHSGSHTYIANSTGNFYLSNDTAGSLMVIKTGNMPLGSSAKAGTLFLSGGNGGIITGGPGDAGDGGNVQITGGAGGEADEGIGGDGGDVIISGGTEGAGGTVGGIKLKQDTTLDANKDLVLSGTGYVDSPSYKAGGTAPVADATYPVYNDGVTSGQVTSITTKGGIITAIAVLP